MSDDTPNLVLEHPRAIRGSQDAMREDIREIKGCIESEQRLGLVEAT